MCAICGYTADDFWASFAIDQDGPLSPAAVRSQRARNLSDWVRHATQAVVARRDQGSIASKFGIPVIVDIEESNEGMSGLFSGQYVKAVNRGYMVSSPTGAMRFCDSLHTVVGHIKNQRPDLCHALRCHWADDYRKVNWAIWGAAWTWNAVMNDCPIPLPERVKLTDGRWLYFESLDEHKVRVTLDNLEIAA